MDSLVSQAEVQRQDLLLQRAQSKVDLPLRFWRQQAHFTTPATGKPARAIQGLAPVARLLARHQIELVEISERTGVSLSVLQQLINDQPNSPLVMVDAEDAVADTAEAALAARQGAVDCFNQAQWGQTLRFFRPAGLGLSSCIEDLTQVIEGAFDSTSHQLKLDGIIWPKVEDAAEMAWLCNLLSNIEARLGLTANTISVQFLVESATAVEQIEAIIEVALARLSGIIWGAADYAADVGLVHWQNDHPLFDHARMIIINAAGAAGVPAIDAMTFNYPTPLHRGDDLSGNDLSGDDLSGDQRQQNHDHILVALEQVYNDAIHGRDLGMSGKWVGHPAQLLMVQAAYREQIGEQQLQIALDGLKSYQQSVALGLGATIIGQGAAAQMADRATDRHLRSQLRRAAANGLLLAQTALQAGLINDLEYDQLCSLAGETSD
ncbi:MAG: hypothetical protein JKY89_08310 [Immundisolibacteraceae bacterium]|nr:hypothetical protein [Immundisolibacteraceae bacterium]